MFVTPKDLEVIHFHVNPDYIESRFVLSTHAVAQRPQVEFIDHAKRLLTIYIDVAFDDKKNKVNICNANFKKNIEIQNTNEPNNSLEKDVFTNDITRVFEEVKSYLSSNIPNNIIEITPPLIASFEVRELASSIYDELKKR